MDTLYALCRAVDHRHALPLQPAEVTEIVAHKKNYFATEAEENPLVREILTGGRITYDGIAGEDRRAFLIGPATFFRTHEILRKTHSTATSIEIGREEYRYNEAVALFARCIPNARLQHVPWHSTSRYSLSLGLAWSITLLVAHIVAREHQNVLPLDGTVLFYMGTVATITALIHTALKRNRDVRRPAPWNSALYLDLNADLLRRDSPALAVARKEFIPQEKPFKTPKFYYALARRIESHGFDAELAQRLPSSATEPGQLLQPMTPSGLAPL